VRAVGEAGACRSLGDLAGGSRPQPGEPGVVYRFCRSGVAPRSQLLAQHPEYYLDEVMTERVLSMAEQAVAQGAEIEVRRFAA
jgi:hypothetical protein